MKVSCLVACLLLPAAGVSFASGAGEGTIAPTAWRSALQEELERLGTGPISETVMRVALEEASRELDAFEPSVAAPAVREAALRAETRLRLGIPLPRVRLELRQGLQIAGRTGGEPLRRLRAIDRARRRLEEVGPREAGGASPPWWMGPHAYRRSQGG